MTPKGLWANPQFLRYFHNKRFFFFFFFSEHLQHGVGGSGRRAERYRYQVYRNYTCGYLIKNIGDPLFEAKDADKSHLKRFRAKVFEITCS